MKASLVETRHIQAIGRQYVCDYLTIFAFGQIHPWCILVRIYHCLITIHLILPTLSYCIQKRRSNVRRSYIQSNEKLTDKLRRDMQMMLVGLIGHTYIIPLMSIYINGGDERT